MFRTKTLFILMILLLPVSMEAAENVHLDLEGQTQGDSSGLDIKIIEATTTRFAPVSVPLELNAVQPDPIGMPEQDDEVLTTNKEEKEEETTRGTETEDIGVTNKDSDPVEMNKADLIDSISKDTGSQSEGIEHEDIGIIDKDPDPVEMNKADLIESVSSDAGAGESGDTPPGTQTAPSQIKVILLAPSEEDGVITRDPGITVLENLSSVGIDDDEFGFVSGGEVYVRAGYVKLGDIKGEVDDSASNQGGNAETAWKVEGGEKAAKKPKEIVVVGSKKADVPACEGFATACEPQNATTPEKLQDYAQRTLNDSELISEIRIDDSKIEIDDVQPFMWFGFIPRTIEQTVSVSVDAETYGKVKVKFPWYQAFGRKTVRPHDLVAFVEESIGNMEVSTWEVADSGTTQSGDRPTENLSFNYSEIKAQTLQTMSNVSKSYNESDFDFVSR